MKRRAGYRTDSRGTVWVLVPRLPMRYTRRDAWTLGFFAGMIVQGAFFGALYVMKHWW